MKTTAPLLPLFAVTLALACSGIDNLSIDATGRAVIPQRSIIEELLGTVSFAGFQGFDLTQSQEFRNQGYSKNQVDSVRLERLTLTIVEPAGADFDFLDRISFHIEAEGLPRVEIARLDPVPLGASVLELEVHADVELQPYVVAPSMTITNAATGTRPPQETTVDARASFDVDVNVSGSCTSD